MNWKAPIRSIQALVFATATAGIVAQANEPTKITNAPSAKLVWETTEEGASFAPLDGNRFEEAYMAMVQLPGGLVSPPHVKSANMFGVVISGTFVHVPLDADPNDEVLLPPGSFYKIPSNLAHISKCVSETPCVSFLYQDGKFDFLPASP